jgi:triphosphoribosyl-dephospho-CoA synthase
LRPGFERMADCAWRRRPSGGLREELGRLGREAEADMLAATGGSNAHRGAIWVLGLLVAARALLPRGPLREVAALAARLARLPDRHAPPADSNGVRVCRRFGVRGARGEAQAGFPHVLEVGLPALRRARRRGRDERCARLDALMAIMASLEDTCLLHRGGWEALTTARAGARRVLRAGGTGCDSGLRALLELDAELKRRDASPGGCADLLAACLFLDDLQTHSGVSPWKY